MFDPVLGQLSFVVLGAGGLTDEDTRADDLGQETASFCVERVNNIQFLNSGDPTHNTTDGLTPGLNTLKTNLPVGVALSLTATPGFVNSWYGSNSLGKYGFVRQISNGFRFPTIWINALVQAVIFQTFFADSIEICLAPGVSGTAVITPWSGIPPIYVTQNAGLASNQQHKVTGGWDWFIDNPAPM